MLASTLPPGSYHWRARTRGPYTDSPWVYFGGNSDVLPADVDIIAELNTAPTVSPAIQVNGTDGSSLGVGDIVPENETVRFEADWNDADGDDVTLEVEVRLISEALDGTATAQGLPASTGQAATVSISGLPNGRYHWQSRIRDEALEGPNWAAYGGNAAAAADFVVAPLGSENNVKSCLGSGAAGGATHPDRVLLLAALFVAGLTSLRAAAGR